MFTLINTLIDRCLFTLMFIAGVQFPEFINQYIQRLSGHLEESKTQLLQFQSLAEQHFDGKLSLLVKQYKTNSDPVIVDSATVIEQLVERTVYLENHLALINTSDYVDQVYYFLTHLDSQIFIKTTEFYTLAIPLSVSALSTGFIIASLFVLSNFFCKSCYKRITKKKKEQPAY